MAFSDMTNLMDPGNFPTEAPPEVFPESGVEWWLNPNFRDPKVIRALRAMMAAEMKARGPVRRVSKGETVLGSSLDPTPEQLIRHYELKGAPWSPETTGLFRSERNVPIQGSWLETVPDPIDRILRGSYFHGMSQKARGKFDIGTTSKTVQDLRGFEDTEEYLNELSKKNVIDLFKSYGMKIPTDYGTKDYLIMELLGDLNSTDLDNFLKHLRRNSPKNLTEIFKTGFPISLHDEQSISNKLGEPAGVSLSMLPGKAQGFSADENVHRVLPLFGGPPQERTVNLMTPEGKGQLNDAYDVVMNRAFRSDPNSYSPLEQLTYLAKNHPGNPIDMAEILSRTGIQTGPFNKQLSEQLQQTGKRHLLYNPRRWDEYEMLALDPKYVLPLDYRPAGEYIPTKLRGIAPSGFTTGEMQPALTATPGVRKGLSELENLLTQGNHRLGGIYSERPWTHRLDEENKRRLIELIDPELRGYITSQLSQ